MLGLKYWYYLLLSWTNVSISLLIIFFLCNMEEVLVLISYDSWNIKWKIIFKKSGYMYMYSRFTLLYNRNPQSIVNQFYYNKN